MEWTISYDEMNHVVVIQTRGMLDIKAADVLRAEGFAALQAHQSTRCLLDHREIVSDMLGTLDIYSLPQKYREMGISHNIRLAWVVPARMAHNLNFYETVCRNNGYNVCIFFDRDTALRWLSQEQAQ